jgi:acetyltransferase-like isoleucine patch superfamily enzyme
MHGERMWHTFRLFTILSAVKRTQYYKDKKIFHSMGENCLIMDRIVPLYARLISLGNNVQIAPGNSVVAGVPAKVISSFEEYLKKRTEDDKSYIEFGTEFISGEMEDRCWREFLNGRNILNKSV